MRRIVTLVLPGAVTALVVTGIAFGTGPIGLIEAPVMARGTNADLLNVHSKQADVKLQTKSPIDFVTQKIVIGPNGSTGWHSHPGPVLVTVRSGQLQLVYASDTLCQGRTYSAGDSFVDRGDEITHNAFNPSSSDNVEFWATYLVPGAAGTAPFRINEDDPGNC